MLRNRSSRLLDKAQPGVLTFTAEKLVPFAFEFVIVDKEVFKLAQKLIRKIFKLLDVRVHVVCFCDRNQSIVARGTPAFDLSPSITPMSLDLIAQPEKAGSSISKSTLIGSPSGASVPGRNPKSCGNAIPAGRTFLCANIRCVGSKAYLFLLPFGVSIMI